MGCRGMHCDGCGGTTKAIGGGAILLVIGGIWLASEIAKHGRTIETAFTYIFIGVGILAVITVGVLLSALYQNLRSREVKEPRIVYVERANRLPRYSAQVIESPEWPERPALERRPQYLRAIPELEGRVVYRQE